MIKTNKLDKSFGPVGTSAGLLIFFVGIGIIYFSFTAIILIIIGAFVGFSNSSTLVDYTNKQFKFSNNLFGIIKVGKWIRVEPDMLIGIKKSKSTWRAYSKGNRTIDISNSDYRLILYNSKGKMILPIEKTNSLDSAKIELENLCNQLGLRPS